MSHQLRHDMFVQRIRLRDGSEGAIHSEGSEGEDKAVERLSGLLTAHKEVVSCPEEGRRSTEVPDDLSFKDVVGDVVLIIVCRGRRETSEAFVTQVAAQKGDLVEVDEPMGHLVSVNALEVCLEVDKPMPYIAVGFSMFWRY